MRTTMLSPVQPMTFPSFGHITDVVWADEQKIALREYMLTVPCDHGDQCINEACILGHRCPAGPGCPRYQKGICRFKAGMSYRLRVYKIS